MPRPAKGAHLYWKKRDGRWVIRDTGGVERGTGCAYDQHGEAEKELQKYLAEKHKPDFGTGDPTRVSIVDALKLYVDERAPHTERPDVIAGAIPHLATFFVGKMVANATPGVCQGYTTWRLAQPSARCKYGPGRTYATIDDVPRVGVETVRRELSVLSAAFGYAHAEHKLLYPVVVWMPEKTPARDRWLSRSEAAKLLWAALGFRHVASDRITRREIWHRTVEDQQVSKKDREAGVKAKGKSRHVARFILTGLYTGTRHEAILRLKWLPTTEGGYVDLRSGVIFRRGIREGESKKRRTPVPMSKRLQAHMERWRSRSTSHVIEFDGRPIDNVRRAWVTARIAAGLGEEVTPHILRHTFATWAVRDGMSFGKVAMALGTTERVVEQVYGHHAPEHVRDVVESVSRRKH